MHRREPLRRRLACTNCRTVKSRCVPVPDSGTSCQRCVENGLTCQYPARRRRGEISPRGSARQEPKDPPSQPAERVVAYPPDRLRARTSGPSQWQSPTTSLREWARVSDTQQSPARSNVTASGINRHVDVDMSGQLDPFHAKAGKTTGQRVEQHTATLSDYQDPVACHLLSAVEAGVLFISFMERLNPMVGLLDPAIHDFSSMRRSSLLFTTIMAAAAKFFRKELYDALISHCQTLLLRSIFAGHCSIDLVQSLILLVFWKTPVDKSAWVNIGIAVRLSHQLGLHIPRQEPLPADPEEAALVRDRERTWFCLSCMDGTYSDIFGLPHTISEDQFMNAAVWVQEATDSSRSIDLHLASSIELAGSHLMLVKIKREAHLINRDLKKPILLQIRKDYSEHIEKWFEKESAMSSTERAFLKWYDIRALIDVYFLLLDGSLSSEDAARRQEIVDLVHRLAEQTSVLGDSEDLVFLQDTAAVQLSTLGSLLLDSFSSFLPHQKASIFRDLSMIQQCCAMDRTGDQTLPVAFVARFLGKVTAQLSGSLTLDIPSEAESGLGVLEFIDPAGPEMDIVPSDFDDVLPDPDGQYWSSLFVSPTVVLGPR
ncbi:hypothetical protein BD324DRAFT_619840 [Kockovaella imperatae]|uniref:Zn(2)-C6 fungal-type domain-containing protein n=1 Tax=Kockovaella imperatae TaxID=4999 RepID=A0A1Y1UJC8_9TREE|nr:hypothetical protein BD324DRAFT_619840 [Kockovaella imperatae]ORX38170.1 hypothetical protein BD324DRAFT_619840 [Kockovaella imperatae]